MKLKPIVTDAQLFQFMDKWFPTIMFIGALVVLLLVAIVLGKTLLALILGW